MKNKEKLITYLSFHLLVIFPDIWNIEFDENDPSKAPTWHIKDNANKVIIFTITCTAKGTHYWNMLQSQVKHQVKDGTLTLSIIPKEERNTKGYYGGPFR